MKHYFVDTIPNVDNMENATLYISLKYNVAIHKCACGCGNEVVTPLDERNGWVLSYNGKNVSLYPSIGNWNLPCQSHYWIREGKICWAAKYGKKGKKRKSKLSELIKSIFR